MTELDERDVSRAVRKLPGELVELLKQENATVAGGVVRAAITGERVSDVDVFGHDGEGATRLMAEDYRKKLPPFCSAREVETGNAITVVARDRTPVQFITRWNYETPEALIRAFDFSIARAAIWWNNDGRWASVCDPRFYVDLASRRLVFMDPTENTAGGTLLRLQKFVARGYRASAYQISRVVQNLAAAAGADRPAVMGIAALVREVDPHSPEWAGDETAAAVEKESPDSPSDEDPAF